MCGRVTDPDRRGPLYSRDRENLERLFAALEEFWGGDVPLAFIGLDALVENKRASGRPKDLDDLDYLTRDR